MVQRGSQEEDILLARIIFEGGEGVNPGPKGTGSDLGWPDS